MTASTDVEPRRGKSIDPTSKDTIGLGKGKSMAKDSGGTTGPSGPSAKESLSLVNLAGEGSNEQTDATDMGTSRSFASQSSPDMPSEEVAAASTVVYMPSLGTLRLAEELPDGKHIVASSSSEVFRSDVRNEWIDAVFGPEFFPQEAEQDASTPSSPPLQGVGIACSGTYVCYTATIPGQSRQGETDGLSIRSSPSVAERNRNDKVGMTLSRIPLGLYVGSVDALGEAYAAGVIPGSVLVDINGMGVLGEPSHKLLERIWQYEGHFATPGIGYPSTVMSPPRTTRNQAGSPHDDNVSSDARVRSMLTTERKSARGPVDGPVALRFIKGGHIYTAVFLTKAPFGISWAPCGNFALVQKSYAHAQSAGVRRGCIVASVNHRNIRNMDHQDAAIALKEAFNRGETISLVLAFTPAESRTAFFEKVGNLDAPTHGKSPQPTKSRKGSDREQNLEYGIGTLLNCVNSNYMPSTDPQGDPEFQGRMGRSFRDGESGGVRRLATRVAAGDIPAPSGLGKRTRSFDSRSGGPLLDADSPVLLSRSRTNAPTKIPSPTANPMYSAMPTISNEQLLDSWNTIDSVVYCVRRSLVRQNTESFLEIGGVISITNAYANQKGGSLSLGDEIRMMTLLEKSHANVALLKQCESDPGAVYGFDDVLLQILTLLSSLPSDRESCRNENENSGTEEEMYEFDAFRSAVVPMLVNLALQSDGFAQRLYFLVRSFFGASKYEANGVATRDKHVLQHIQNLLSHRLNQRRNSEDEQNQKLGGQVDIRGRLECFEPQGEPTAGVQHHKGAEHSEVRCEQQSNDITRDDVQIQMSVSGAESFEMNPKKAKRRSVRKKFFRMLRTTASKREGSNPPPTVVNGSQKQDDDVLVQRSSEPRESLTSAVSTPETSHMVMVPSLLELFHNAERFLLGLDDVCRTIERSLLKSFSQKITEWALQPWSMKETVLSNVTAEMRRELGRVNFHSHSIHGTNIEKPSLPIMSPVHSSEVLFWVNPDDCFILPSAHFPLLLSFDVMPREDKESGINNIPFGDSEMLYRTQLEVLSVERQGTVNQGTAKKGVGRKLDCAYFVHCTVGGQLLQTDRSMLGASQGAGTFRWNERNSLSFETRSFWGAPKTAALRISSLSRNEEGVDQVALSDEQGMLHYTAEEGYCFLNLDAIWKQACSRCHEIGKSSSWQSAPVTTKLDVTSFATECNFDSAGEPAWTENETNLTITLRITGEVVDLNKMASQGLNRKRVLLYKHDDDMRQEMLAIQFLETCHRLLCASGLDLKVRTFRCLPVGPNRGFIEWVAGSVPLSEVCKPSGSGFALWGSSEGSGRNSTNTFVDCQEGSAPNHDERKIDSLSKSKRDNEDVSGLSPSSSGWCKYESLRSLRQQSSAVRGGGMGGASNNPIQEFLRSAAFDSDAPYFIRRDVMDTYVKSCASYSVITYLLGVGDRHLDNLLLHPNGHFLHCDYSFILGQDPKTYLPMRITEEMVLGMGGRESDNYAKFISLSGAAFLALRQHYSVRVLMSLIRNMATSDVPDICSNQSPELAISGLRSRFRLDLDDEEALSYIENLIETSIASKIWIAVDAIHSLGKHF